MQGRAEEAVAPLEKAARTSRDPEVETQLAIALRQAGDSDKALTWLKRAVKRTPPFAPAFHELGFVLHSLGRSAEAIDVLRQGLAVAPMMTELAIQLGFVCYAINDRANAGAAFAHALSVNPVHPEAIQGLGTVLMDAGDYAQAAELVPPCAFGQSRRHVGAHRARQMPARARRARRRLCLLARGERARARNFTARSLRALLSSGHGRFWLRPSSAAKFLKGE